MTNISAKIADVEAPKETADIDIEEAAKACNDIALDLNETIKCLKPKDRQKALGSLWSALRSGWKKSKIENIKGKLEDQRRILSLQLLKTIQ
jgi:hypothetical protein